MLMMVLLLPGGLLGGYGGDPDGVNGSWEKARICVSTIATTIKEGKNPCFAG